jgi:acyl carrier protein
VTAEAAAIAFTGGLRFLVPDFSTSETNVTYEELRRIMADVFECDPAVITPDATPETVPAWDSLRLLDLILALEQQAGVEISPERLQDMMSVPAILDIINEAAAA